MFSMGWNGTYPPASHETPRGRARLDHRGLRASAGESAARRREIVQRLGLLLQSRGCENYLYNNNLASNEYSTMPPARIARMLRLTGVAALICASLQHAPALADEYRDLYQLYRSGDPVQALERIDAYLAQQPRDSRVRFLKGVILAEQARRPEAIAVFTELTQDFPELPEPYNNLAVVYAAQGNYARARETLEMAVRTHPGYATAYENLGDVYAMLASGAYEKAAQLDRANTTAPRKLALTRELFAVKPPAAKP
jgi:tetratricopeptide (TPR) repeat protein